MPLDMFFGLLFFAFVMAWTPGPNNIMLTASGVNFGFGRTIPHMLGVTIGFLVLIVVCATGLGAAVVAFPFAQTALKVAGAAYLLWLAWKVANAGGPEGTAGAARPLTFFQGAAFQWVNPKGVLTALGAAAIYVRPERAAFDIAVMLTVFAAATISSVAVWTAFGVGLQQWLRDPQRARGFNIAMALLLVASLYPVLMA